MANDLIYDIGMHNGNDTAFYLACGYRVIAVEADPNLVAMARERFRAELTAGKLVILNVAIAEHSGSADFWINSVNAQLNSFNKALATAFGEPCHSIIVQCRRLDDILAEYGTPYYLKIDIEGCDIICCDQLLLKEKPQYISVEMSQIELILKLRDLKYDRFKLINQRDLQPVDPGDIKFYIQVLSCLHCFANRKENRSLFMRLRRLAAAQILRAAKALCLWDSPKPFKSRRLPEWRFEKGVCSGSFGEDILGEWLTWEEAAYLWHRDLHERQKLGLDFWWDIHATISAK
jgi:FkbM family methyltransferase